MILKPYHQLVNQLVYHNGFAYGEGGDEIVLLLPNHQLSDGIAFAECLRMKTEEARFKIDEGEESFTISLGVAERQMGESLISVKTRSNAKKKLAKQNGRNQVQPPFIPSMR